MKLIKYLVVLSLCCVAVSPVLASDFDGSKPLVCATIEARDCVLGRKCFAGHPRELGAPGFFRIDFTRKTIKGPQQTAQIVTMKTSENQLLMQGTDLDYGWAFAIKQDDGDFSAALTNINGTFILFGSCTLD